MDFNFQYFTGKKINQDSITFSVYDFEYTTAENSKFVIIGPTDIDLKTARRKPIARKPRRPVSLYWYPLLYRPGYPSRAGPI